MTCPACGVDIRRAKRALSDPWAVNRDRAGQSLVRHLEHGGNITHKDMDDLVAVLLAIGAARRRSAPRVDPLTPYTLDGIETPQN